MVVEHRKPRCGRVRGLQIGIGLVLGVALAIVGERHRFRPDVVTNGAFLYTWGVLVLVITKVHNEIGMFVGQPAVRGEPALLEVRARHGAYRQRGERARFGRRAGAAGR